MFYYLVYKFQAATGLLDGDDVGTIVCQSASCLCFHEYAGTSWHIIENDRQRSGFCNGLEMSVKPLLRWFVVVWTYAKYSINPLEITHLKFMNHSSSIVSTAAHENRYTAFHLFHDLLFDA